MVRIIAVLVSVFCSITVYGVSGVDTSFNSAVYANQNLGATVVKTQPDGKVLIGGNFTVVNGVARHGVARLNADGTLDTSFDPPDFYDPTIFNGLGLTIYSIEVQSTGKILVGGQFSVIGATNRDIVRLNTDGSLDTTFTDLSSELSITENVIRIIVRPDDSIFMLGAFSFSNHFYQQVAKLDANGTPDPTFSFIGTGGNIKEAAVQADGRLYVSDIAIGRYMSSGAGDSSYHIAQSSGGTITEIAVQPDNKILIAGTFSAVDGFTFGRIARLNTDGTVDLSFNTNGLGAGGPINDIVLAADGKIFVGGSFSTYNGVTRNRVAKLNSDGTLDNSFVYTPPAAGTVVNDMDLLPTGKLAVVGTTLGTTAAPASVVVLNADGSADAGFTARNGKQGRVREINQQPDGKVVIGGEFTLVNGIARNSMARLNVDGSLDAAFVPYFNTLPNNQIIYAVMPQPDGKILVGGVQGIVLRRLNADGSQDTGFVTNLQASAAIYDVDVLPDGKILIAGSFKFASDLSNRIIARLNADGSNDTSFVPDLPNNNVYRIQHQSDGKIFIGGDFTQIGITGRGRIARLNADGSLDNSFNPPGGASGAVYDLDVQADGKVVIGGAFPQLNGSPNQVRIGRLNADGSLDSGFVQTVNNTVNAVKVQPDGRVLIGGVMSQVGGAAHNGIARLLPSGVVDAGFNVYATIGVLDISLQQDNKVLLAGEFTEIDNVSRLCTARLLNSLAPASALFDYDGDGKADVSVFRPSTNRWYVFKSSDATVTEATFGLSGDVASPADYDGDGKTDLAIFRPSSGDWWYMSSINGAQVNVHWGASGDVPRPSDFDGDGKTDYVVFRPSNSVWYRFGTTGAVSITSFGLAGDKPVTGDFDGDGRSDIAIFRPSSGDWWYQSSINGAQLATHWGASTDIPAAGDYDGDHKTDLAVYRPSNGTWYILNSSTSQATILNFGIAEDKPVTGDYDGDGKADIAVFRPSTGVWYMQRSTAGFSAVGFGISTDVPTENAFVP